MQSVRVENTKKEEIMRTFLLMSTLMLLISQSQSAQVATDNSSVIVLDSKWSKSRQKIENADNKTITPAESVLPRSNRNFERNQRANATPGTPDPNERTIEGRSAALEKAVQDSRTSKFKIVDGFTYQAKIRNAGTKIIEILFWEYQFKERANPANVSSRQFLCGVKIKPDKEQELSVFSTLSPGDLISAGNLDNNAGTLFEEKILINRVEYADGTILQRKDWNYSEIKKSIERVLETAWGREMCRNL
jgi:hypothetical protein